jgi:hypothetical protein
MIHLLELLQHRSIFNVYEHCTSCQYCTTGNSFGSRRAGYDFIQTGFVGKNSWKTRSYAKVNGRDLRVRFDRERRKTFIGAGWS